MKEFNEHDWESRPLGSLTVYKKTYNVLNIQATYETRPRTSSNLAWLDLRVMHCNPLGEAITYAQTSHDVFMVEPHGNIKPGFGSPSIVQVLQRATDIQLSKFEH